MSFSSKMLLLGVLAAALTAAGCIADTPDETESLPWAAPRSWEGVMPLPGASGSYD